MDITYYTELILDGFHTQCTEDLMNGKILIQDVLFEFRNTEAYMSAYMYAKTIKDDEERHERYWQIRKLLVNDIYHCDTEYQWKDRKGKKCPVQIHEESEFFSLIGRINELSWTYNFLFNYATKRFRKGDYAITTIEEMDKKMQKPNDGETAKTEAETIESAPLEDYYVTIADDMRGRTQCELDLEEGKIHIQDVPFQFREWRAYFAAHIHARMIPDAKKRHHEYWLIQEQLEDDLDQCQIEKQERENGFKRGIALMPHDTKYFNLENHVEELEHAYKSFFCFMEQFFL